MKLSSALQEALLALVFFDPEPGGAALVRGLVDAKMFDPFYKELAQAAYKYFDQFGKPPLEHTLDIVQALQDESPQNKEIYGSLYSSLLDTKEGVNRDYVVARAKTFVRFQRIKLGLGEVLDCLDRNDEAGLGEAEKVLARLNEPEVDLLDYGTEIRDVSRSLRFMDAEHAECAPTGIRELDEGNLGPQRKRLHIMMGPLKSGKSWWLVQLGKHAIRAGWRVLHVTLENSEEETLARYCQALFAVSKREAEHVWHRIEDLGHGVRFEEQALSGRLARPAILDDAGEPSNRTRELLRAKLQKFRSKPLIVKEFPTASLTIEGLKGFLDALEARGTLPDLLLLDYGDLLDVGGDGADRRLRLGRAFERLRGIAVERNIAIATVTQTNKQGSRAKVADAFDAAEDVSKGRTADTLLTYNATPAERALGLARIYVAAARNDRDGFQVMISQCYGIGQFSLSSHPMVSSYFELVAKMQNEDLDDE